MAMTGADVKAFVRRFRLQSEIVGVAALATIVAVALGVMARRQLVPLDAQRDRLRSADREIAAFRAAFQATTPDENAFRFPDSLAVGVVRDVRFTLAQQVSQRAEQSGMSDVRVRFAGPDTVGPPQVPDLPGERVAVADYTITLDGTGDFSTVLGLLRGLPPSVALQQMTAVRAGNRISYHLTLAVFETSGGKTNG